MPRSSRQIPERPPRIPRPPRELGRYFYKLWPTIIQTNRVRPMDAKRTVRHPDGSPVAEEGMITFRVPTPDLVEPLLAFLDQAVRLDAAAWAGYDGWGMSAPTPDRVAGFLAWPDWISLEIYWERRS